MDAEDCKVYARRRLGPSSSAFCGELMLCPYCRKEGQINFKPFDDDSSSLGPPDYQYGVRHSHTTQYNYIFVCKLISLTVATKASSVARSLKLNNVDLG